MGWFFALFFVSGFCSILYEIVWLRLSMAQFGVTSALISIVLSMCLEHAPPSLRLSCGRPRPQRSFRRDGESRRGRGRHEPSLLLKHLRQTIQ
jgi:hypothetical protein